jgi:hypothetical protein
MTAPMEPVYPSTLLGHIRPYGPNNSNNHLHLGVMEKDTPERIDGTQYGRYSGRVPSAEMADRFWHDPIPFLNRAFLDNTGFSPVIPKLAEHNLVRIDFKGIHAGQQPKRPHGRNTPLGCALGNVVLNQLDRWAESQWQRNPVTRKYKTRTNCNGSENLSNAYSAMKETRPKEMYIVRYADDFRIFCRTISVTCLTKPIARLISETFPD